MNRETLYHRQLDIVPLDRLEKAKATIIGVGAVGSFTAFTLGKMGIGRITVYDDDTISVHNLPNQMYRHTDVGKPKVYALQEIVRDFHGVEIEAINEKYVDQQLSGIVIVAVDSMDARIAIWERVKYNPSIELFIDSRMGAEVARLFCIRPIDPDDVARYENSLHPSSEAIRARCTAKATVYCACGLASLICAKVKKHLAGDTINKSLVMDFKQAILLQQ